MLRLDQQNNQITPEDKLTVLCEITIDGKDVQQSGQALVEASFALIFILIFCFQLKSKPSSKICPEKMSTDFNFLLESGQFSDVTIKCEGTMLSCHKVILGARYGAG